MTTEYKTNYAAANRLPVDYKIIFAPTTGSKRPYEIWYCYSDGRQVVRGSFKTSDAANKRRAEKVAYALKVGWWAE